MASLASFFSKFFFSLLLLLHLGCFIFTSSHDDHQVPRRKRKSPLSLSSPWSFFKRVFSNNPKRPSSNSKNSSTIQSTTSFSSSPRSSHHSVVTPILDPDYPPRKRRSRSRSGSGSRSEFHSDFPVLPLRNEIIPCPSCGEIFNNPNLLEHHQSTKHAVSELLDGDSGKNVVWIIFQTGWATNGNSPSPSPSPSPNIHRILKIHNSPRILSRFEDYRETVKARAARGGHVLLRDERCIADGNELLRFHCTTLVCNLGQNGNSSICSQHYCSACGIIRAGFSPKLDGIATLPTSWRAHVAIPGDVEAEFAFMNVRRAMLVCRVVAGRVGCDPMVVDKEGPGFDSLVGRAGSGPPGNLDEDELLVFNPRAVLPCFLIVYSV